MSTGMHRCASTCRALARRRSGRQLHHRPPRAPADERTGLPRRRIPAGLCRRRFAAAGDRRAEERRADAPGPEDAALRERQRCPRGTRRGTRVRDHLRRLRRAVDLRPARNARQHREGAAPRSLPRPPVLVRRARRIGASRAPSRDGSRLHRLDRGRFRALSRHVSCRGRAEDGTRLVSPVALRTLLSPGPGASSVRGPTESAPATRWAGSLAAPGPLVRSSTPATHRTPRPCSPVPRPEHGRGDARQRRPRVPVPGNPALTDRIARNVVHAALGGIRPRGTVPRSAVSRVRRCVVASRRAGRGRRGRAISAVRNGHSAKILPSPLSGSCYQSWGSRHSSWCRVCSADGPRSGPGHQTWPSPGRPGPAVGHRRGPTVRPAYATADRQWRGALVTSREDPVLWVQTRPGPSLERTGHDGQPVDCQSAQT